MFHTTSCRQFQQQNRGWRFLGPGAGLPLYCVGQFLAHKLLMLLLTVTFKIDVDVDVDVNVEVEVDVDVEFDVEVDVDVVNVDIALMSIFGFGIPTLLQFRGRYIHI